MASPCPCRGCTAAYNAGLEEGKRLGYRDGYNAHAYTLQHWRDTHGPYRNPVDNPVDKQ